jgi:HSP20 family protein
LRGFFRDVSAPGRFWQPRADVHETPTGLVVKVEVAGVRSDRLNVSLSSDDRVLTISGERLEDDEERLDRIRCYQLEVSFGPFERQVTLPAGARIDREAISATYRDGILVVLLPKRSDQAPERRSIPVSE